MGLFGLFNSKTSHKNISKKVVSHIQTLGAPKEIGTEDHRIKFLTMLKNLDYWAEENNLGDWKRSAIAGEIEAIFRTTYRNTGYDDVVQEYVNLSRKIILDLSKDYNW